MCLLTLGIYGLWWHYMVKRELADYSQRVRVRPALCLLALLTGVLTLGISQAVTIFRTGRRICLAQEEAGLARRCSPVLGLLLAVLGSLHVVYYQAQLDEVWEQSRPATDPRSGSPAQRPDHPR